MSVFKCFWVVPSGISKQWLRRYASSEKCAGSNGGRTFHDGVVLIDDGEYVVELDGHHHNIQTVEQYKDDSRWPQFCECGYEFVPSDEWQLFSQTVYTRPGESDQWILHESFAPTYRIPTGAMWHTPWMARWPTTKNNPDGVVLSVMTPAGVWLIDGPSSNGDGWVRQGEIPQISVTPSILVPSRYHGFLTAGVLESTSDSQL